MTSVAWTGTVTGAWFELMDWCRTGGQAGLPTEVVDIDTRLQRGNGAR